MTFVVDCAGICRNGDWCMGVVRLWCELGGQYQYQIEQPLLDRHCHLLYGICHLLLYFLYYHVLSYCQL